MVLHFKICSIMPSQCLMLALIFVCLVGCTSYDDKKAEGKQAQKVDMSEINRMLISRNSASDYLTIADLDKFRPGRTKDDILKDVQWRGYLYMAAYNNGKSITAIVYSLASDGQYEKGGVSIWAIFINDKFVKFVKPPPTLPGDKEKVVTHDGTPWNRPKPLKAGDKRFLIRGMNGKAVSVEDLKKEAKSITAPPKHVDPGLTAAYLYLIVSGAVPAPPGAPASEKDYLRNAALRDQFNPARLNIGMSEAEVEATLKAKPLESGRVEAGKYKIYGSNESFDISTISGIWHHFSNILVVFRDGKVIAISSIPAGYDWRRELAKAFLDLPVPPE